VFEFDLGGCYVIQTKPFEVAPLLMSLFSPKNEFHVLAYIFDLHQETGNKLIKEILDEDGNDLIPLIDKHPSHRYKQVREFLMRFKKREILEGEGKSSFKLGPLFCQFESLKPAIKMSKKLKKLYTLLGITERINGKMYLNLDSWFNLTDLMVIYSSFLPKPLFCLDV